MQLDHHLGQTEKCRKYGALNKLADLAGAAWPIDHIFASPGIRALTSESIGNNAGSDHFPVFMTLAIPVK
jgi:endonuclease/exonuclease/phosphatase (EEP) superfamily protein YafD